MRPPVGLHLFLVLSNHEKPTASHPMKDGILVPYRTPHAWPLSESLISLVIPAQPHRPLAPGACQPHCHLKISADRLFAWNVPSSPGPRVSTRLTSSFHSTLCSKNSHSVRPSITHSRKTYSLPPHSPAPHLHCSRIPCSSSGRLAP